MKKLFKYLKGSYFFVIISPLLMLLEVTMDLLQPKLMSNIIDIGVKNGDINYVLSVGIRMLLISFIGFIGGAGCTFFSSIASMEFGTKLRQAIFDKIQTLSFSEIDKLKPPSLITRITNDVTQVQNIVLMMLRVMVRAPFLCIGGVFFALSLSLKLSTIFLVSMPILVAFVIFILRKSFPLFLEMQNKIDRVNTVMRENLLGVRVIKAFLGHEKEKQRFGAANDDLMNWSIRSQKLTILLMPFVTLVMNLSVVALLWFGGNLVINGELETGKVMAYMNYLVQILFSLMMTVMMLIGFSRAKVSADRINEVFESEPSVTNPDNPQEMNDFDVEFKNVCFSYDSGEDYVLKDISFTAKKGEIIGIIGGTGSGKSTLVGLIPRFYDATGGLVLIGGVDVKKYSLESLKKNIGVVLQESILFSGTVEENLRWGNEDASKDEIETAIRDAQAYEFLSKLPDYLKSGVEQRGKNFSGGQRQRLAIARTLVQNPKILILDDATSAVDMATEAKLLESIKKKKSERITFIIAQRISAISDADKIIVLDEGTISGIGTHRELLKTNEIYRSIAATQLGEEAILNV